MSGKTQEERFGEAVCSALDLYMPQLDELADSINDSALLVGALKPATATKFARHADAVIAKLKTAEAAADRLLLAIVSLRANLEHGLANGGGE